MTVKVNFLGGNLKFHLEKVSDFPAFCTVFVNEICYYFIGKMMWGDNVINVGAYIATIHSDRGWLNLKK